MAYSNNPNLPRARAFAMRLLIADGLPSVVVARKCGIHRSTVWRWKQKWLKLNENISQEKPGRPTRKTSFVPQYYRWNIQTENPTPHSFPHAISQYIVLPILELRRLLNRCTEVIWHYLASVDHIRVSLSSVRRTLRRHHAFDGSRKHRVRPDNPRRPHATKPGELVQTDTIHYICPTTYQRRYVYTVIDLYSRMAYAEMHARIRPGIAADVVLRAQRLWGFKVAMIQADNGSEFSSYFERQMLKNDTVVRHSRLGRPNDNAHIERFNRTIQEECLGSRINSRVATATLQQKIDSYIEFYNTKRIHLGLQLKIPVQMLQRF